MGVRVLPGVKGRGRWPIQLYNSKHLGQRTKSTNTKQLKPSLAQNTDEESKKSHLLGVEFESPPVYVAIRILCS